MTGYFVGDYLQSVDYQGFLDTPSIEGFKTIDYAIDKIRCIMKRGTETTLSHEELDESLVECSLILDQTYGNDVKIWSYSKFINLLLEGILAVVIPSLEVKEIENLFSEMKLWWKKYKQMADCLVRLFRPLLSEHPDLTNGQPFERAPMNIICELVFDVVWCRVKKHVTLMIRKERDGQVIDQGFIKEILDFSMEIQEIGCRPYYDVLERAILADTSCYCLRLSSGWLLSNTFGGYIQKVEDWWQREEKQKRNYLSDTTIKRLLEVGRSELMDKVAVEVAELIPSVGLGLKKI